MKTKILAVLGATFAATTAFAADLPRKSAPVAPVVRALPAFTWTGFYVGVNAGYGFGQYTADVGRAYKKPSGFVGGGQIGYNYQVGQTVFGVETDLSYSDIDSGGKGIAKSLASSSIDYFGTVRGRVGYAVDRFLPYLTAGYAYGGGKVTVPGAKTEPVYHGYALGAGVEYAFTNNLTARVEGLYVDLADRKIFGGAVKSGAEFGVVRAGLNAKF